MTASFLLVEEWRFGILTIHCVWCVQIELTQIDALGRKSMNFPEIHSCCNKARWTIRCPTPIFRPLMPKQVCCVPEKALNLMPVKGFVLIPSPEAPETRIVLIFDHFSL